jgi:hypothetical protein
MVDDDAAAVVAGDAGGVQAEAFSVGISADR